MADTFIRDAVADDFGVMAAIAAAGDSEADQLYLTFVAAAGSLRVVVGTEGEIVPGAVLKTCHHPTVWQLPRSGIRRSEIDAAIRHL